MVLIWIGIAIGVLIAIILVRKLLRTSSHEAVRLEPRCKKCGQTISGTFCQNCKKKTFGV